MDSPMSQEQLQRERDRCRESFRYFAETILKTRLSSSQLMILHHLQTESDSGLKTSLWLRGCRHAGFTKWLQVLFPNDART